MTQAFRPPELMFETCPSSMIIGKIVRRQSLGSSPEASTVPWKGFHLKLSWIKSMCTIVQAGDSYNFNLFTFATLSARQVKFSEDMCMPLESILLFTSQRVGGWKPLWLDICRFCRFWWVYNECHSWLDIHCCHRTGPKVLCLPN